MRYDAQIEQLATLISARLGPSCASLSPDALKELATGMAVIEFKYLHLCTPSVQDRVRRFNNRVQ